MDRASDYGSEGWGFESLQAHETSAESSAGSPAQCAGAHCEFPAPFSREPGFFIPQSKMSLALIIVVFMLHSIYAISVGRKSKEQEARILNSIETLRIEAGLTRQDLADAVGVHYQTVGYLERGEYAPSLVLAIRIARVLGRPVESIFSLDGNGEEQ